MNDKKSIDEINLEFQEFQDDLTTRSRKLRLLPEFNKDSLDDILSLLDITQKNLPNKKGTI